VPEVLIWKILDEIIPVKEEDSGPISKEVCQLDGIPIGSPAAPRSGPPCKSPASGKCGQTNRGHHPSCAERYLSSWLFADVGVESDRSNRSADEGLRASFSIPIFLPKEIPLMRSLSSRLVSPHRFAFWPRGCRRPPQTVILLNVSLRSHPELSRQNQHRVRQGFGRTEPAIRSPSGQSHAARANRPARSSTALKRRRPPWRWPMTSTLWREKGG